jgi:hypothetical protein
MVVPKARPQRRLRVEAQPGRTAEVGDPYAKWCGRRREASPYADQWHSTASSQAAYLYAGTFGGTDQDVDVRGGRAIDRPLTRRGHN